jgi:putative transposase
MPDEVDWTILPGLSERFRFSRSEKMISQALRIDFTADHGPRRGIVKLRRRWQTEPMKCDRSPYHGHRFPAEIISHAIWHYYRFCLSFRDVEDLLAKRGIIVSYETIRQWCLKFGPEYARRLKRRQGRLGDTWFLDEVFLTINGKRQYLWRAVDQDGDVIDILVQSRRNRRAAERFFLKLLKGQGKVPFRLVTDKLKSYGAALRTIMPSVNHATDQYANNRAEVSHQPTRQRERQMRRFKSPAQTQRFLSVHGLVLNLFRLARHRLKSAHHRMLRERSFATWSAVTAG